MGNYSKVKSKLQSLYPSKFIEGVSLGAIEGEKIGIMANHRLSDAFLGDTSQSFKEDVTVSIYSASYSSGYMLAIEALTSLKAENAINTALTSMYSNALEKYVIEFSIKGE